jgi:protein O-GlcNAc transferase
MLDPGRPARALSSQRANAVRRGCASVFWSSPAWLIEIVLQSFNLVLFEWVQVKTRRGGKRRHPGSTGFASPRVPPLQPAPSRQHELLDITLDPFSDATLQAAIDAHLAGRVGEAEAVYEQFVANRHANTVAYTNLAAIRLDQGREPEAITLWRQALQLRQDLPDAWFDLGNAMLRRHQPDEACTCYERALALKPDHVGVLINMSSIALNQGDSTRAMACAEQALALQSDSAEAACNVASSLRQLKRLEEAEGMARHALSLNPALQQATKLLAGILHDRGDHAAAETLLRQSLEQGSDPASTHQALGHLLRLQHRLQEAIVHYQEALALDDSLVEAWSGIAHCYFELHDTTRAIDAYRRQEALRPSEALVAYNLGVVLKHQGDLAAAAAAYADALRLKPDYELALHGLVYTLNFGALQPMEAIAARARSWCERHYPPEDRTPFEGRRLPLGGGKLRVGFLSAEIGNHAVSFFLESFLRFYDRDRLEVYLYESLEMAAEQRFALHRLVDGVRSVAALKNAEARQIILDDQIDILVDTTACMRSSRLALLAQRCAPIQCHYIGFHGSTGVPAVDYYIGDPEYTPSEYDHHVNETIWRLPRCFVAYQTPANLPPISSGDPNLQLCFGCFNNLTKIGSETLDLWVDVLRAIPDSRLLIKDSRCADLASRERLLRHLRREGIAPDRIELVARVADWSAHMALYNRVDIALDTIPLNSGTTGFDALVMGVPLVAMRGNWMGARLTATMLKALGRPEWIADNPTEYVQILQTLAADRVALAAIKESLRAQVFASELCDQQGLARDLGAALGGMVDQYIQTL